MLGRKKAHCYYITRKQGFNRLVHDKWPHEKQNSSSKVSNTRAIRVDFSNIYTVLDGMGCLSSLPCDPWHNPKDNNRVKLHWSSHAYPDPSSDRPPEGAYKSMHNTK